MVGGRGASRVWGTGNHRRRSRVFVGCLGTVMACVFLLWSAHVGRDEASVQPCTTTTTTTREACSASFFPSSFSFVFFSSSRDDEHQRVGFLGVFLSCECTVATLASCHTLYGACMQCIVLLSPHFTRTRGSDAIFFFFFFFFFGRGGGGWGRRRRRKGSANDAGHVLCRGSGRAGGVVASEAPFLLWDLSSHPFRRGQGRGWG